MLNEEAMTSAVRVVRPLQPYAATVVASWGSPDGFTNVPYSVNHSGPAREEQQRRDGPSKPRKAAVVTGAMASEPTRRSVEAGQSLPPRDCYFGRCAGWLGLVTVVLVAD